MATSSISFGFFLSFMDAEMYYLPLGSLMAAWKFHLVDLLKAMSDITISSILTVLEVPSGNQSGLPSYRIDRDKKVSPIEIKKE